MKKRLFKMKEIVESLPNDWVMPDSLKLTLTFRRDDPSGNTTDTHPVDVFESSDWIDFFASYYDFGFNWLDTGKSAFDTFVDMYTCWVNNVKPMLDKAVTASMVYYDPISNYDRTEHGKDRKSGWLSRADSEKAKGASETSNQSGSSSENGKKLSVTTENKNRQIAADLEAQLQYQIGWENDPETELGYVSAYGYITGEETVPQKVLDEIKIGDSGEEVATTLYTRPFDGSTPKEDSKNVTTGSVAAYSAAKGNAYTNTSKTNTSAERTRDTTENDLHAYGNIGVTTNSQMVTEELKLRFNVNFAKLCHEMFVRDNLYYGGWD